MVMENFILYYLSAAFPNWEMEVCTLSNKNKLCSRAIMLLLKECELSACQVLGSKARFEQTSTRTTPLSWSAIKMKSDVVLYLLAFHVKS